MDSSLLRPPLTGLPHPWMELVEALLAGATAHELRNRYFDLSEPERVQVRSTLAGIRDEVAANCREYALQIDVILESGETHTG